jgi:hypothetical protein
MKTISLVLGMFLFIGCANKFHTSYDDYSDLYFIGRGSALKSYDIDKSNKEARLRALNDLTLQIQSEVTAKNTLQNNTYIENVEIRSNVILKKWRETKVWEKDGYIWSEVILNKDDYYSSIDEYIKEINNEIDYNLNMSKNGTITNRLEFYIKALNLSQNFDNERFNNIKFSIQNFIDNIKIVPKSKNCNTTYIDAKVFVDNMLDSSLNIEWFIQNNKVVGSLKLDDIKLTLLKYGVLFSNVVINPSNNVIPNDYESFVMPKIRIDTIYNISNKIIVEPVQIVDTISLRNSKFFVRKRYGNDYSLFSGIRANNSKLSVFTMSEDIKPLNFIKTKFYRNTNGNFNNDIEEIYFDDNNVYAENVIKIYYINDNKWDSISMVENFTSQLTVVSEPIGAQVFINNEYVGVTPYYMSKSEKPYAIIKIKMNGYYISEYFTSLLLKNGITKKFILKKMPELKYGVFIDPDSYYAEDVNSVKNLNTMLKSISTRIGELKKIKNFIGDDLFDLYHIQKKLLKYEEELENRVYCQYISVNNNLNLTKSKNIIGNLSIDGSFDIPTKDFQNININVNQCFIKLEYKKYNEEFYRYGGIYLVYLNHEYLFNGKYSLK